LASKKFPSRVTDVLRTMFPPPIVAEPMLVPDQVAVREARRKVVRFVAAPNAGPELTIDMRGTPFERRVWNALRTIPVGKPLTYAQLACRISEPKSVRAIARACAANPIALAIPCHRVIGHNGTLTGYRWGIERKLALINRETAMVRSIIASSASAMCRPSDV
jgi:O-6-methylguanine DNA methyltransferase